MNILSWLFVTAIAHFFPNHGRAPQPNCENQESLNLSCSHFKVIRIYTLPVCQPKSSSLAVALDVQMFKFFDIEQISLSAI
jgi:hypothetical protein